MTEQEVQQQPAGCLTVGAAWLGRYDVLSSIGRGGMGEVYKCTDRQLGQTVAVKVLTSMASKNGSAARRLINEAKLLGALKHPNIVRSRNFDISDEGLPYIVMEFVEGESLQEIFVREKSLSPKVATQIFE